MLYVTTRSNADAYTVYNALTNDRCSDGGVYVPFRLPVFKPDDLLKLGNQTFNQTVAEVLNIFFALSIQGRDLDLLAGKNFTRLVTMSHKIVITELWHNIGGKLSYFENALFDKIEHEIKAPIAKNWVKVAVKIAIIFGIYGQMLKEKVINPGDTVDFSVKNDCFITPLAIAYCRAIGLPIHTIICTCDEDNSLWDFIHRGNLNTVGLSDDFLDEIERLIYLTLGAKVACEYSNCRARQFGFLEKVFFIGIGGFQPGRLCAGIDGHGFRDNMGQINNGHGSTFLFGVNARYQTAKSLGPLRGRRLSAGHRHRQCRRHAGPSAGSHSPGHVCRWPQEAAAPGRGRLPAASGRYPP